MVERSFEFKIFVIEQINNGQISVNFAANKYQVSRSALDYWRKKLSNYNSKNNAMSLEQENKKLRERVEELEFIFYFKRIVIKIILQASPHVLRISKYKLL